MTRFNRELNKEHLPYIDIDAVHNKSQDRKGSWMQTYCGIAFWPLDPHEDEILLEDIAHALSLQCRFSGMTRSFYSVAQHSILAARELPQEFRPWGLLHDASEAYLHDMIRPIKDHSSLGVEYKKVEYRLMSVICKRFGLPEGQPECVSYVDLRLLMTEARDVLGPTRIDWRPQVEPFDWKIDPWSPAESEERFLDMAIGMRLRGEIK